MSVDLQSLHIHPDGADLALAQQQTRFNALVRDVALWRAALAEWQERIARYEQTLAPVRRELHAAWRQWVFTLDHASLQPGLSRAERGQLGDLLRETAAALLQLEDDAEVAEVASRHAEGALSVQATPEDADAAGSEQASLEDPAQDWEQQAAVAAAQRAEWAAQRRAASASKRRRKEEQEVSGSVRDVYRRLASALHPDREPDARQRERKTALMQQANQAYAEENLLALLELQLQAELIDAAHLASVDRRSNWRTCSRKRDAWRRSFVQPRASRPGRDCRRARPTGSSPRKPSECAASCSCCDARPGPCWTWKP